jgi:hypothetical protein
MSLEWPYDDHWRINRVGEVEAANTSSPASLHTPVGLYKAVALHGQGATLAADVQTASSSTNLFFSGASPAAMSLHAARTGPLASAAIDSTTLLQNSKAFPAIKTRPMHTQRRAAMTNPDDEPDAESSSKRRRH